MKKMSVFDLYMEFPSPCGDKLQYMMDKVLDSDILLPSPCGDKL